MSWIKRVWVGIKFALAVMELIKQSYKKIDKSHNKKYKQALSHFVALKKMYIG